LKEAAKMLKSRTKKYNDGSDENNFRFVFYCDQCGSEYRPASIAFTGGGEGSEHDLKWKAEHDRAFARADRESAKWFYRCPSCGEYVCNACTRSLWENGEIVRDVCRVCYDRGKKERYRHTVNGAMTMEPPPPRSRAPTAEPKPLKRR
jgi:hypothetical protein